MAPDDEIPEPCDVCGDAVTADNLGQRTADCLMCHECVTKYQAAVPTADDEADLGENDPTPLELGGEG